MPSPQTIDALLAGALRGEPAPWPGEWQSEGDLAAVTRRLLYHGIAGLLVERRAILEGWPVALLDTMREETLVRTMWEMRHRALLSGAVEALHDTGVLSVLLKGTALAYAQYAEPAHRFRGDSDLLVAPGELERARETLAGLGWRRPGHTQGPFGEMHYQEIWQFADPVGLTHDIDLHWEVTNSMALRAVLDGNQLLADAIPLPALSPHALAADPATALIHRAVNRAEHARSGYFALGRNEYDPDRLIWAVDLDLLARDLTPAQWEAMARRGLTTGVGAIVRDALAFARKSLGTQVPEAVLAQLAAASLDAPATRFLLGSSGLSRALADLRATPGAWPRLKYVLARAFPSPNHIRVKYPGRWPLGLLYLRRLTEAALNVITGGRA